MTNLFDQYVESILESTSFLDLPDSPPYGFWISPGGEFFVVRYERHEEIAKDIINKNPKLKNEIKNKKITSNYDLYYFLASRKYIRVVESPREQDKKYFADLFAYDDIKNIDTPFTPTNSSMKTLKDIAEFYGMRLVLLHEY